MILVVVIGYWASAQISEQGFEERFRPAVGKEREKEHREAKRILPIEVENISLYIAPSLATAAFGLTVCYAATLRRGE